MLAAPTGAGVYLADQQDKNLLDNIVLAEQGKLKAIKNTTALDTLGYGDVASYAIGK